MLRLVYTVLVLGVATLCQPTAAATASAATQLNKVVKCYYGTWATYRQGLGEFSVQHIHPRACTHLVYTFVGLNHDGTVSILDPYLDLPDDWGRDNFRKFNELKQVNAELKTILAVGGWNEYSAKYSVMAKDPTLRAVFVASATETVLTHGFDGLDMDWEYPNQRDSVHGRDDVDNFSQLLRELRHEFDKHGLLLTAAVASVEKSAHLSYDIPAISQSLHYVSLMTYDMNGAWDNYTGHNSPLYRGEGDEHIDNQDAYTVDAAVQYWLDNGCPAEKLLVGLPFYGRSFTLTDANNAGVRAPVSGAGVAGAYTVTPGVVAYNEFCVMQQASQWDIRYDALARVPYAVRDRDWVTFDDEASLTDKVEYALDRGLAGVMIWSIESDDFHGLCHGETYHLLRVVNRAIGRNMDDEECTSTTLPSNSTAPSTPTTDSTFNPPPNTTNIPTDPTTTESSTPEASHELCHKEGFVRDPHNCSIFYRCIRNHDGVLVENQFECPAGLFWDISLATCNYPDQVDCRMLK